ncbi:MAG: hypothetical protein L0Y54_13995 [Sporichthyaceae bacterium]|nr:hypothetical protein [Sporichthyaceae bacterium]
MSPDSPFLIGIAPEHRLALVAALVLPLLLWAGARLVATGAVALDGRVAAAYRRYAAAPVTMKWLTWLLLLTAVIHVALPLGHDNGGGSGLLFVAVGVAYGWLAMRALSGRRWRLPTALLLIATLIGYLLVVGPGQEEPDHVGIATALDELAALGLCLIPARGARRGARKLASTGFVVLTILVGAIIWVGMFAAHQAGETAAVTTVFEPTSGEDGHEPAEDGHEPADDGHGQQGGHGHSHGFTARAQAGVIMRPVAGELTDGQREAAEQLAAATTVGIAKYTDLRAAQRDGYRAAQPLDGLGVHFENKAYQSDGRILDPTRPEQLVYAIEGGRAVLLGAVYQMQTAGVPGPAVGGSITRWHAHNVCLTITPPGFGVVSPFGTCPSLTLTATTPEMMHVWTIEHPDGPFAEEIGPTWIRRELADHGQPLR